MDFDLNVKPHPRCIYFHFFVFQFLEVSHTVFLIISLYFFLFAPFLPQHAETESVHVIPPFQSSYHQSFCTNTQLISRRDGPCITFLAAVMHDAIFEYHGR
jgi:hypothetical protein